MSSPADNLTVWSQWDDDGPHPLRTLRPRTPEPGPGDGGTAGVELRPVDEGTLVLGATLGQGGMGIVHAGIQRSLGREVAVKQVRSDAPGARHRIVREAIVTGALAHPNIVPVYDLRRDEQGSPLLVMKRIEGESWAAFLDAPERLGPDGARDIEGWHVRVLLQVCNAVAFAHSRGVLHRDLKPANVMIGRYGEVYLLDWGIALALPGCTLEGLPPVDAARGVAGTPAYMAPEQATAGPLSAATDVWLLGAMLYEILHHHPPYVAEPAQSGESAVHHVLRLAAVGRPPLRDDLVPELAGVLTRALAPRPEDRYPTVEAFRTDLTWALDRREARSFLVEVRGSLERLREATGTSDGRAVAVHTAAARAGLRRVLTSWPDDAEARATWREVTEVAVRWHLAQREPASAALLLADDEAPDEALVAEVAVARAAAIDRERRLAHAEDRTTGARTRAFVLLLVGLTWVLGPLADFVRPHDHVSLAASTLALAALGLGLGWWARESLSKSALNSRVRFVIVLAPLVSFVGGIGGALLGLDIETTRVVQLLGFTGMAASWVPDMGWRIVPVVLGYAAAFVIGAAAPSLWIPLYVATNTLLMITLYLHSWREVRAVLEGDLAEFRERRRS